MTERSTLYTPLRALRRQLLGAASALSGRISVFATLLRRELTIGRAVNAPWRRRLWLWRRGFTSRSDALFDVTEENYREYVSDLQHELANDIAGSWDAAVNNKLMFYLLFGRFSTDLPDLYGMVDGGELRRSSPLLADPPFRAAEVATTTDGTGGVERANAVEWLDAFLDATGAVVLKPVYGQGGRGVLVCRRDDETGDYRVNGEGKTRKDFAHLVADLDEYLAWEYVEQDEYATALFPESTNTLRVITMWDYDADAPFVAGAVQRVGTVESAPVDNWSQGGLSAEVSDDGTLSAGAQWLPSLGEVRWYENHPDTGARIEGARVPGWPTIRERIESIAADFPYLPRLGWDVVVTRPGSFAVLEVNAHAATRTIQVHRPLLTDPRVRRFYEHHGRR